MTEAIITIVTGSAMSLVTWLLARRRNSAEISSQEIDNAKKNAEYYQVLVDDWFARYKDAVTDLQNAAKTIQEKDRQINELMSSIQHLTEELKKYKQLNGKV